MHSVLRRQTPQHVSLGCFRVVVINARHLLPLPVSSTLTPARPPLRGNSRFVLQRQEVLARPGRPSLLRTLARVYGRPYAWLGLVKVRPERQRAGRAAAPSWIQQRRRGGGGHIVWWGSSSSSSSPCPPLPGSVVLIHGGLGRTHIQPVKGEEAMAGGESEGARQMAAALDAVQQAKAGWKGGVCHAPADGSRHSPARPHSTAASRCESLPAAPTPTATHPIATPTFTPSPAPAPQPLGGSS